MWIIEKFKFQDSMLIIICFDTDVTILVISAKQLHVDT